MSVVPTGAVLPGPTRIRAALDAVRGVLPTGRTLPEGAWRRRHRAMLWLLWGHAVALAIAGTATGDAFVHGLGHGAPLALVALLASRVSSRKAATALVSLGLLSASALLVHITNGVIEAHFHFFVMIAVITLYEDWLPFLLAGAYVVGHHGLVGVLDPNGVYNHAAAQAHPWRWALIHGAFVAAAGAASVVTWRLNEDLRAARTREYEVRAEESEERFRSIFDHAPVGITISDVDGRVLLMNPRRREMLHLRPGQSRDLVIDNLTHPEDRAKLAVEFERLVRGESESYELEKRDLRADGTSAWVNATVSLIRRADGTPAFVVGLVQDVEERKLVEQERERMLALEREQNERLRELDRLKDDFVASVSHELRTPLTSIHGYAELLRDGELGELTPEQEGALEVVKRNANRLLRVVSDLLFVAQMDAGTVNLNAADVDLARLVADSVEAARPAAERKRLELRVAANETPQFRADPARLGQVLDNLISNAVKFTPPGGIVEVRTKVDAGAAVLEVADTGVGIPAGEQERLFERFYRASGATEQAVQGTGLGLAITKAIVEAHRGTIAVESSAGAGTTVRVALPLEQPRARGRERMRASA